MIGCLIIHGYTGGPYEIEPLIRHLQEQTDWEIEVPILSGHGRELDLTNVAFERWLEESLESLQQLSARCETVYVIGFSMGGMIASYLAAIHPVDKLVLLAPARKYISFKYITQHIGEVIGDGLKGKLKENEIYLHYKDKLGEVPLKANVEFMKLVAHTKPFLADITVPVFIAQGQRDGMVPFQTVYDLEKEIGSDNKEVVLFEKSDHHLCLGEDSEMLKYMVLRFLKRQGRRENLLDKEE